MSIASLLTCKKGCKNRGKFFLLSTVWQHVASFICTNLSSPMRVDQHFVWRQLYSFTAVKLWFWCVHWEKHCVFTCHTLQTGLTTVYMVKIEVPTTHGRKQLMKRFKTVTALAYAMLFGCEHWLVFFCALIWLISKILFKVTAIWKPALIIELYYHGEIKIITVQVDIVWIKWP